MVREKCVKQWFLGRGGTCRSACLGPTARQGCPRPDHMDVSWLWPQWSSRSCGHCHSTSKA
jgi:hypothetical protein